MMQEAPDWSKEKGSDAAMSPDALEHAEREAEADEPKFGDDAEPVTGETPPD